MLYDECTESSLGGIMETELAYEWVTEKVGGEEMGTTRQRL